MLNTSFTEANSEPSCSHACNMSLRCHNALQSAGHDDSMTMFGRKEVMLRDAGQQGDWQLLDGAGSRKMVRPGSSSGNGSGSGGHKFSSRPPRSSVPAAQEPPVPAVQPPKRPSASSEES